MGTFVSTNHPVPRSVLPPCPVLLVRRHSQCEGEVHLALELQEDVGEHPLQAGGGGAPRRAVVNGPETRIFKKQKNMDIIDKFCFRLERTHTGM